MNGATLQGKPVSTTSPTRAISTLLRLEDGIIPTEQGGQNLEHYLFEEFVESSSSGLRRAYYVLKPFIPRFVQLAVRKRYTKIQEARTFPQWPIEPTVVEMIEATLRHAIENQPDKRVGRLSYWPDGKKAALVITHDVEWDSGLRAASRLVEVEKRHGFCSSWNIVPERYPIDWSIVDGLRKDGFEIGVHGLKHDGKLFNSHELFQERLVRIHEYAKKWGAVGFRSPATLRNVHWMPELRFEYDSSYTDTDPYEPQAGGCCTIWPFFIGDLLEMPITMPQDHTLFEILGHDSVELWKNKANWIESNGGMILINVHPDYIDSERRLKLYEEFLVEMKAKTNIWNALPKDVARWWKDRSNSQLKRTNGCFTVEGPAAGRAAILLTTLENGMLCDKGTPN